MSDTGRDVAFVGDVHLDRDDPDLEAFVGFLDDLGNTARSVVLIGDLFNLWIGRREMEQPHHERVLAALADLRRRGVAVRYVEGNRDYGIGPAHGGAELDDVTTGGLEEVQGSLRIFAVHGDLANPSDRQYRTWRRISRSPLVWWLFHRIPGSRRVRLAEGLEARMRASNREFKGEFPEQVVRDYGARFLAEGFHAVVLGHFHVEKELAVAAPPGRILVLPDWKSSRRYLRVSADGAMAFVDSRR